MRKIVYGVGASLDGYIARLDGTLDFLHLRASNYSMGPFFQSIDVGLMERKTYEAGVRVSGGKSGYNGTDGHGCPVPLQGTGMRGANGKKLARPEPMNAESIPTIKTGTGVPCPYKGTAVIRVGRGRIVSDSEERFLSSRPGAHKSCGGKSPVASFRMTIARPTFTEVAVLRRWQERIF